MQSSVSHDPSEIILVCWFSAQLLWIIIGAQLLIMVIIINIENSFCCNLFFWYILSAFFDKYKLQKKSCVYLIFRLL